MASPHVKLLNIESIFESTWRMLINFCCACYCLSHAEDLKWDVVLPGGLLPWAQSLC